MRLPIIVCTVCILLNTSMASRAAAKIGKSESQFTATPSGIHGEISFHWHDLSPYFDLDENGNGLLDDSERETWDRGLKALCETFFTLWIGPKEYQMKTTDLQFDPATNLLVFKTQWNFPPSDAPLEGFDIAFVAMEDMDANHAHDLTVVDAQNELLFHESFHAAGGKHHARPGYSSSLQPTPAATTTRGHSNDDKRPSIALWVAGSLFLMALAISIHRKKRPA